MDLSKNGRLWLAVASVGLAGSLLLNGKLYSDYKSESEELERRGTALDSSDKSLTDAQQKLRDALEREKRLEHELAELKTNYDMVIARAAQVMPAPAAAATAPAARKTTAPPAAARAPQVQAKSAPRPRSNPSEVKRLQEAIAKQKETLASLHASLESVRATEANVRARRRAEGGGPRAKSVPGVRDEALEARINDEQSKLRFLVAELRLLRRRPRDPNTDQQIEQTNSSILTEQVTIDGLKAQRAAEAAQAAQAAGATDRAQLDAELAKMHQTESDLRTRSAYEQGRLQELERQLGAAQNGMLSGAGAAPGSGVPAGGGGVSGGP